MPHSTPATIGRKLLRLRNILRHRDKPNKISKLARQIRKSNLFDIAWYLRTNPDVQKAGLDPVEHYLRFGAQEGRDPSPLFSTREYIAAHPQIEKAGVNPLIHHLRANDDGKAPAGLKRMPSRADYRNQISSYFVRNAALPVFLSASSKPRVNLVVDTLDNNGLYGAVGTAIVVAALMSQRTGRKLRVVTRDTPPAPANFQKVLSFQGVASLDDVEFAYAGARDESPALDVAQDDLFITTSWWTTWAVKQAVPARGIIYLVQDDERIFYPNGDERLRCSEILASSDIRFVVNTQMLFEHLVGEGFKNIAMQGAWFEPSFSPIHYRWDETRDRSAFNFLFYARPGNLRNLYYRGLEVLAAAIETGVFDNEKWSFHFAGKDLSPVALPRGISPTLHQNLAWADYATLVRSIDLGLCLMQSPHPSYPPLDLAASGAVVLSSRCGGKTTLDKYSTNIICADTTTDALLDGIRDAVSRTRDLATRRARFADNGLARDWSASLDPVLAKLAGAAP